MPDFHHQPIFDLGEDTTPYRLLTTDGVEAIDLATPQQRAAQLLGMIPMFAFLAAFMGGMGLGAWAYHRAEAKLTHPLRLYAGLEVAIAVSALVSTPRVSIILYL